MMKTSNKTTASPPPQDDVHHGEDKLPAGGHSFLEGKSANVPDPLDAMAQLQSPTASTLETLSGSWTSRATTLPSPAVSRAHGEDPSTGGSFRLGLIQLGVRCGSLASFSSRGSMLWPTQELTLKALEDVRDKVAGQPPDIERKRQISLDDPDVDVATPALEDNTWQDECMMFLPSPLRQRMATYPSGDACDHDEVIFSKLPEQPSAEGISTPTPPLHAFDQGQVSLSVRHRRRRNSTSSTPEHPSTTSLTATRCKAVDEDKRSRTLHRLATLEKFGFRSLRRKSRKCERIQRYLPTEYFAEKPSDGCPDCGVITGVAIKHSENSKPQGEVSPAQHTTSGSEAPFAALESWIFFRQGTEDNIHVEGSVIDFLSTPVHLELAMVFGRITCLYAFWNAFLLLPVRLVAGAGTILWRALIGCSMSHSRGQKAILNCMRAVPVALAFFALCIPDIFAFCGYMGRQNFVRIHVLLGVAELTDKLGGPLLRRAWGSLYRSIGKARVVSIVLNLFFISSTTCLMSLTLLIHLATLAGKTVTSLETLVGSILKRIVADLHRAATKKASKEEILESACQDIVDQTKDVIMMSMVVMLRLCRGDTDIQWMQCLKDFALVVGIGIVAAWIKHSIAVRISGVAPSVYHELRDILVREHVVRTVEHRSQSCSAQPQHHLVKTMTLTQLPMIALLLRVLHVSLPNLTQGLQIGVVPWEDPWTFAGLLFVMCLALKVVTDVFFVVAWPCDQQPETVTPKYKTVTGSDE